MINHSTYSNQLFESYSYHEQSARRRLKFILSAMILVTPLFDLATGYYQMVDGGSSLITPTIIYRGVILTTIFFWLTFLTRSPLKIFIIYLLTIFALSTGINLLSGNEVNLIGGLQRFLKLIYPLIGLGALIYFSDQFSPQMLKKTLWSIGGGYGLVICGSIIITYLTGTGLSAYTNTNAFSNAAYFDSQNGLSIVLGTSLLMMLYYIHTYINRLKMVLLLAVDCIWLLSAFLLSTRTAIIITPVFISLFHIHIMFDRSNLSLRNFIGRIALIGIVIVIGYQIFHFWQSQNVYYHLQKFEQLSEIDFRRKVPIGLEQIYEYNILEHFFGAGEAHFMLTETDFLDIYGKFGLLTLLPLLVFFGSYTIRLLLNYLARRNLVDYVLVLCFGMYGAHGAFAGHAFANAIVNNLFFVIYFLAHLELNVAPSNDSLSPYFIDFIEIPLEYSNWEK